jgi:hypothetical protein
MVVENVLLMPRADDVSLRDPRSRGYRYCGEGVEGEVEATQVDSRQLISWVKK